MPDGQSKAAYIIICSGQIDVLNAPKRQDKLKAASDAARHLTSYYGERCTAAQTAPISDLQHEMMDNFDSWNNTQVDSNVAIMFGLLHDLEDEMEG